MNRFETEQSSRTYRHQDCLGTTTPVGGDLLDVRNPFQTVARAVCSRGCKTVPLESVAWCETGEDLVSYGETAVRRSARFSLGGFQLDHPAVPGVRHCWAGMAMLFFPSE